MTCAIVIRAFNEERHIGRLLEGVLRQSGPRPEIVVVDSGSTDGTLRVVEGFPARVVRIAPGEFSFGRSLNRGIAATKAPFVVMASAHVYPQFDDWLVRLLQPFDDPAVAVSYGRQRGDARTKFSEHRVFEQWFPDHAPRIQAHPFCNNANSAIRRELWEELPYDESLTGLEDIAWARRMIERGRKVAYVPEAVVVHVHEETPSRVFRRYQREAMALRRIDPDTHFGFDDMVRLFAVNVAHDMASARRAGVARRHAFSVLTFRFLQFFGTWRGFARRTPVSSELKKRFYYPSSVPKSASVASDTGTPIDYGSLEDRASRRE